MHVHTTGAMCDICDMSVHICSKTKIIIKNDNTMFSFIKNMNVQIVVITSCVRCGIWHCITFSPLEGHPREQHFLSPSVVNHA